MLAPMGTLGEAGFNCFFNTPFLPGGTHLECGWEAPEAQPGVASGAPGESWCLLQQPDLTRIEIKVMF